ncbi:MAG: 4-hydroxyphenylacetate decarboxylase small subunit [Candidatus Wallbacteria bacterium]|nr:4-hydroxyphenylacetate decarboxylase small subunit [Candidatus Wallbacteria bacterium]
MTEKYLYRDVIDYVPVDAVKGIDVLSGEMVSSDDFAPPGYRKIPKCKFCSRFSPEGELLGFCEESKNRFMAYPDLIAVTCESYSEKK